MSNSSFYKWRSKYSGMDASLMTRMKELVMLNSFNQKLSSLSIEQLKGLAPRFYL
jgi:hypothetical protein